MERKFFSIPFNLFDEKKEKEEKVNACHSTFPFSIRNAYVYTLTRSNPSRSNRYSYSRFEEDRERGYKACCFPSLCIPSIFQEIQPVDLLCSRIRRIRCFLNLEEGEKKKANNFWINRFDLRSFRSKRQKSLLYTYDTSRPRMTHDRWSTLWLKPIRRSASC